MSEPRDRLVGLYLSGAPSSRYRVHADACTGRGEGSLTPCCPKAAASVGTLIDRMRGSEKLAARIAEVRAASGEAAQELKARLPAFTPSGLFYGARLDSAKWRPTGIVALDFDGVADAPAVRDAAAGVRPSGADGARPCTIAAFVSPSGAGVKALVHVTPLPRSAGAHKAAYAAAFEVYQAALGLAADAGNDCTRLCFLSYDPDLAAPERTWGIEWTA